MGVNLSGIDAMPCSAKSLPYPARERRSGFSNEIDLTRRGIFGPQQLVARLCAKVGHIDDSCRIVGLHTQDLTGPERLQPLARLEHGQGAKQPQSIKIGIKIHATEVGAIFQLVHQVVTTWTVTSGAHGFR